MAHSRPGLSASVKCRDLAPSVARSGLLPPALRPPIPYSWLVEAFGMRRVWSHVEEIPELQVPHCAETMH